jgi:hypothetical protein
LLAAAAVAVLNILIMRAGVEALGDIEPAL